MSTPSYAVGAEWHYVLVTETDIETDIEQAKGSWSALKKLGS
jgi:hypothetical protein